ncbi:dynein axonemal heavy chain 6-like [Montipora capricornis]|uniref:dynein axonemal heavy chain 6-like n=1 Tax=Montipora capricornis TaxID=246305 RepID=UPI0035F1386F
MAEVDSSYQYSLKYFKQLYNSCIENSEKTDGLDKKLEILFTNCTNSLYTNVARFYFFREFLCGFFKKAISSSFLEMKLILKEFILGTSCERLHAENSSKERPPKPDIPWLNERLWHTCWDLEDSLPAFTSLKEEIVSKPIIVKYEFNDSDRESPLNNLSMFLAEEQILWDARTFITGQIPYGGRDVLRHNYSRYQDPYKKH